MSRDAKAVANKLLDLAESRGNQLTQLELLKLIYYCNGWMWGIHKEPLIRQPIKAWKYGPVVVDVYESIKHNGSDPIRDRLDADYESFSPEEESIIDQVYEKYGLRGAVTLIRYTHSRNGPWYNVWNGGGQYQTIPDDLIRDYFKTLLEKTNGNQRNAIGSTA